MNSSNWLLPVNVARLEGCRVRLLKNVENENEAVTAVDKFGACVILVWFVGSHSAGQGGRTNAL
jgi:hypothetical protein